MKALVAASLSPNKIGTPTNPSLPIVADLGRIAVHHGINERSHTGLYECTDAMAVGFIEGHFEHPSTVDTEVRTKPLELFIRQGREQPVLVSLGRNPTIQWIFGDN